MMSVAVEVAEASTHSQQQSTSSLKVSEGFVDPTHSSGTQHILTNFNIYVNPKCLHVAGHVRSKVRTRLSCCSHIQLRSKFKHPTEFRTAAFTIIYCSYMCLCLGSTTTFLDRLPNLSDPSSGLRRTGEGCGHRDDESTFVVYALAENIHPCGWSSVTFRSKCADPFAFRSKLIKS